MAKKAGCKPKKYLIFVWGDVEPQLKGPFKSRNERNNFAKKLRKKEGDEHSYFPLDINKDCKPEVWAYSGAFFED